MSYVMKEHLANKANYGSKRDLSKIKYLVIHYTSNDGDSDEANGKYFANNVVKASAHYFVDDDSVTHSVPDDYVAYSVGVNRLIIQCIKSSLTVIHCRLKCVIPIKMVLLKLPIRH